MDRWQKPSLFFNSALIASTVIGLLAGSSFFWAPPDQAWYHLITGFLWVLIVASGTGLAQSVRSRVQRGEWFKALTVGCSMTFPPTTVYIVMVLLTSMWAAEFLILPDGSRVAGRPDLFLIAPMFYTPTLVMAFVVGPGFMLTSPFKERPQEEEVPVQSTAEGPSCR